MTEPTDIALKISKMMINETIDDAMHGVSLFLAGFILLHANDEDEAVDDFLRKLAVSFEDLKHVRQRLRS